MAEEKLPPRSQDSPSGTNQLVLKAQLADYAPVRGCMMSGLTVGRFGKMSSKRWTGDSRRQDTKT